MTASLPNLWSSLCFFLSGVANDGESRGLSSFLSFFSSAENNEPPSSSSSLGFFPQMQKMTMSWEAPDSLSSLGFFLKCELTNLHHHLMHHYYTFLYVGMSPPLNKCKGKEERGSEVYNIWIGSWPKGTTPVMLDVVFSVLEIHFIQFVNGHSIVDNFSNF